MTTRRARQVRRRRLAAGASIAVVVVAIVRAEGSDQASQAAQRPSAVKVRVGTATVAVVPAGTRTDLQAVQRMLPGASTDTRGRARIQYAIDRRATAMRVRRTKQGSVEAVARFTASRVPTPVFQQAQRNSCESAALSILLGANGIRVDQRLLQRELPRSGPLDPVESAGGRVWGDPDRGYVGRADGTGTAGGFGVYPGPVRALAARHGFKAVDLTGQQPAAIYARLRAGRAVMVWIGLGAGPYAQWKTESGRDIEVNLNEHTVVLDGIRRDGSLSVSNPLQGTREVWSRSDFETMWDRLGRRAIS